MHYEFRMKEMRMKAAKINKNKRSSKKMKVDMLSSRRR